MVKLTPTTMLTTRALVHLVLPRTPALPASWSAQPHKLMNSSAEGDGSRERSSECHIVNLVIQKCSEEEGSVDNDDYPSLAWRLGVLMKVFWKERLC